MNENLIEKKTTGKKIVFGIIAVACIIAAAIYDYKQEKGSQEEAYRSISMVEAEILFEKEDGHIILDVRRADEFDEGHIPGAINIANEDIVDTPPEELDDFDQIIYVYCHSGNRSKQAAEKLAAMGYTGIVECGGINDWTGEIEVTQPETEPDSNISYLGDPFVEHIYFINDLIDRDPLLQESSDGSDGISLNDEVFEVTYNGFTINAETTVDDVIAALGIPEGYEENNGGYISSEDGFWWELMYPEYGTDEWDIKLVMRSEEGYTDNTTTKKGDSVIMNVQLMKHPTNRGIKVDSSIESVIMAYGMPTKTYNIGVYYAMVYEANGKEMDIVVDPQTYYVQYVMIKYRD